MLLKNNLFDDLFEDVFGSRLSLSQPRYVSATVSTKLADKRSYRCSVEGDSMVLSVDLPGVKPADVKLSADEQHIVINYVFRGKDFEQTYIINEKYNRMAATAKLENGVLDITIPSAGPGKGKLVNIAINTS